MIFPGDAEFKYVEQARNNPKNSRVYVLKFQGSSERLFFWMQNPSAEKDEENMRKINSRIAGTDDGAPGGGLGNLDQQQLLSMLTRAAAGDSGEQAAAAAGDTDMAPADEAIPAIPSNTAQNLANAETGGAAGAPAGSTGGGAGGGAFNQAALQQMLANLGGGGGGGGGNLQAMAAAQANREGPSLSDVLDGRHAQSALAELPELQQALLEHLPEGDQSVDALNEVLRSPQMAQAVGQLDHVLQSGQGRELLLSFGLQPAQGFDMYGPAAVKNMLDQLQKKAREDSNP